jgi:hypothetical protein
MSDAAWEDIITDGPAASREPSHQAAPHVAGKLKLHRSTCLLLDDDLTGTDVASCHKVASLELHQITATQPAVDREVQQSAIPKRLLAIEEEADGPDLLLPERPLRADGFSGIPSHAVLHGRV